MICQLRIKITALIKVATKATNGVAVRGPRTMMRKGMATNASPNPNVDRARVEMNSTPRVAIVGSISLIG